MTTSYATLESVTDPASLPPSRGGAADPGLTADDLAVATGGQLLARSDRSVLGAAVDSREVVAGNLFVALPGERTDGHLFVADAVAHGAAAVLVSRPPDGLDLASTGVTVIQVPDTLRGLQSIAATWRTRFDPLVVGVTGSIAKTSTKEAIATVLAGDLVTLKNEGNQNNEIGLPLTVMRLRPDHQAAVLEMGMYVGGEIAELARIGRPEIGVVTAVQPVHLSRIGTIEAVERAKGELVEALPPDGVAVLNADDERVRRMADRTSARVVTYGFATDAVVRAEDVESAGIDGMRFTLVADGSRRPVAIPTLGRLAVHNALAAAAVGLASGIAPERVVGALAAGWSAPHRGALVQAGGVDDRRRLVQRFAGVGDCRPRPAGGNAWAASRRARRDARTRRGIRSGARARRGRRRDRRRAARRGRPGSGRDCPRRPRCRPQRRTGSSRSRTGTAALAALERHLRSGDVVLVKASRGIELDRLVDALVEAATVGRVPGDDR